MIESTARLKHASTPLVFPRRTPYPLYRLTLSKNLLTNSPGRSGRRTEWRIGTPGPEPGSWQFVSPILLSLRRATRSI